MSPIFNHHALNRLPTIELDLLRAALRRCLNNQTLTEEERAKLHAALASVERVLRTRSSSVPGTSRPRNFDR